jgi:hypothetical protein
MAIEDESKKKLDDLTKKCNDLADNQVKGLPKKIEKMMLSDRQIAKKIISFKSPKLSDDDLNLIVYGKDLRKELGPSYKKFVSENENLNPDVVSKDKNSLFKPLDKDSPVFDEVKKIKTEVKDGIFILQEKSISFGKEVGKLGIMIGSTIPAASLLVAPLNFNVPGALTLTLNLVNAINKVNFELKEFTPALRVVDKLKFVLPDDKVDDVITPINTTITSIKSISDVVSKLQLPLSEVKERELVKFQEEMNKYDTKLKELKLEQFIDKPSPEVEFEKEKERLTKLKEGVSSKVEQLLK